MTEKKHKPGSSYLLKADTQVLSTRLTSQFHKGRAVLEEDYKFNTRVGKFGETREEGQLVDVHGGSYSRCSPTSIIHYHSPSSVLEAAHLDYNQNSYEML